MFDIGANLTSSHFSDDLDSVLDESFEAGVKKICITSSNLQDVRNAKKIIIKVKKKTKFNLLYDRNSSLQKKIKLEQLRKETY